MRVAFKGALLVQNIVADKAAPASESALCRAGAINKS